MVPLLRVLSPWHEFGEGAEKLPVNTTDDFETLRAFIRPGTMVLAVCHLREDYNDIPAGYYGYLVNNQGALDLIRSSPQEVIGEFMLVSTDVLEKMQPPQHESA